MFVPAIAMIRWFPSVAIGARLNRRQHAAIGVVEPNPQSTDRNRPARRPLHWFRLIERIRGTYGAWMTTATHVGTASNTTRGAWTVTAVQWAYIAWFGVCVTVVLFRAADFAGHIYVPHQGDRYTETANIWSGWAAPYGQPLMWTATFQPFIAIAAILATADARCRLSATLIAYRLSEPGFAGNSRTRRSAGHLAMSPPLGPAPSSRPRTEPSCFTNGTCSPRTQGIGPAGCGPTRDA